MEDVEERRKRLAAMREQAAAPKRVGIISSVPSLWAPPLLANPSLDYGDVAAAEMNGTRFDYYTDPLAGFQGSKRRRPGMGILPVPSQAPLLSNSTPHGGAGILPHPAHLQRVYVSPGSASWQPMAYQPSYLNPGFSLLQPPPQFYSHIPHNVNQFPNQPFGQETKTGYTGRYNGRQTSSGPTRMGGSSGSGYPTSSSGIGRGSDSVTDSGGRGNASSGRSPSGESRGNGNSSEGGRANGRGQGGPRVVSAKEQPHLFAKKSMLEDPWEGLGGDGAQRT